MYINPYFLFVTHMIKKKNMINLDTILDVYFIFDIG